jgi:hypothetical protein
MIIDTKRYAEEYFEHNNKEKKLYVVLLTKADIDLYDIDIEGLDVLATEENNLRRL